MSSPISGFTAIPNPQMLAFMPIQSYLMMYFAGAGWQIGKRKISAIPSPEFNKMSAADLLKGFNADLREALPSLESALRSVEPMIAVLVEQYGRFFRQALEATPQAIQAAVGRDPQGYYPFGREGEQLGRDILALIKSAIPSAPGAEARVGGRTVETNVPPPITSIPSPAFELPTTGRIFQGPEVNPVTGEAIFKPPQDLPPPQIQPGLRQRPAGQSQILEKEKLIREITSLETRINAMRPINQIGRVTRTNLRNELYQKRQLFANLKARYSF